MFNSVISKSGVRSWSLKLDELILRHGRGLTDTASDFELQHKTPPVVRSVAIPVALYGGRHTVTLLPGMGIGPELLEHVRRVLSFAGAPVDFERIDVNGDGLDDAIVSIKRNGVAIKGNIELIKDGVGTARNLALRNALDLYVYVMRCKSLPSVPSKHDHLDVVLVRQNTEGEYSMLEHQAVPGVVESLKVVTENNARRVARYAFEYARKYCRKRVTTVHKANIMKRSDGYFLEISREIAKEYPEIHHDDMIVDNCSMQLVSNPQQFDILLTPNLYGNICGNILCGIAGGPGLYSAKNLSEHYAVFEVATRCRGSDIAGKDVANPVGMLQAALELLYHLGHDGYAELICRSIYKTLVEDGVRTADVGGTAPTSLFIEKLLDNIKNISRSLPIR